jgi:O-antigen/teichoic acid export membrane protein
MNAVKEKIRSITKYNHFGRVLVNAGWLGSAMPLTMVAGILKAVLLARLLGVSGLGTYGLVVAFTAIISMVFGFSSTETVITFTNKANKEQGITAAAHIIRYCIFFDALLSLITYSIIVFLSRFFADLFHLDQSTKYLVVVYGLVVIFNATGGVCLGLLRTFNCFRYVFLLNVARSWVSLACFTIIYLIQGKLILIFVTEAFLAAIFGVLVLLVTFRILHTNGVYLSLSRDPWWQISNEVWKFQLFGYLRMTILGGHRHVATLALGYLAGPIPAGVYQAAKRLSDPLKNGAQIFAQSLYPQYSMLWFSGRYTELKRVFVKTVTLCLLVGLGMLGMTAPFMGYIIGNLYGVEFNSAVSPTIILLLGVVILMIAAPINAFLPAVGRNRPHFVAVVLMFVIQILLLLLFVPIYGATGAAWAFVLAIAIGNFFLTPKTLVALRKGPLAKSHLEDRLSARSEILGRPQPLRK